MRWVRPAAVATLAILSGCASSSADNVTSQRSSSITTPAPLPTVPPVPAILSPATTTTAAAKAPAASTASAGRTVHRQAWTPFAAVSGVVLRHPSAIVERVGFHQSNHDGARELQPLPTAAAPVTLEPRHRGTGARTAADVVVDPDREIRAPVTGRVRRAGRYVLYCRHSDDFAVIEPDAHPGWEVKVLHIDGVAVRAGDRVVAGQTLLAQRPTRLPFASQVDEVTAKPSWPHVHMEVVDPSIPDRPSGRRC